MSVFKGHDDLSLNRYYYSFYSFSQSDPYTIKSFVYDQNQTLIFAKDISFNSRNVPAMLSFLENSQSNPYALGKSNDEYLNMDIAFAGLYKKALSQRQQQTLMTSINKKYKNVYYGTVEKYIVTIGDGTRVVYFNGDTSDPNPLAIIHSNGLYIFDQSHPSNANYPLAFRAIDTQTPYTTNVIIEGTPGTPNSYSVITVDNTTPTNLEYYIDSTEPDVGTMKGDLFMGVYVVKTVENWASQTVFTIKAPFQDVYYDQPDLSFNSGDIAYFYVGDTTMTDFSLVFGPTLDSFDSTFYSSYVSKSGNVITLDLSNTSYPVDASGVYYFEDTSAGMGYVETPYLAPSIIHIKGDDGDLTGITLKNHISNSYGDASIVGTVSIDTSVKKVGTGSLKINGGPTNYVNLPNVTTIPQNFSISFWLKVPTPAVNDDVFLWYYHNTDHYSSEGFGLKLEKSLLGSNIYLNFYQKNTRNVYTPYGNPDSWHHICLVFKFKNINGNNHNYDLIYYIDNNTKKHEAQYTANYTVNYDFHWFGGYPDLVYLDDFRFYDYALSDSNVSDIYRKRKLLVTVSNGVFVIDGVSKPQFNFTNGETYVFDQSDSTNAGFPIVFGETPESSTLYTNGVTVVGTPGQTGAYTKLVYTDTIVALYYYNNIIPGMGYDPNAYSYYVTVAGTPPKFYLNSAPQVVTFTANTKYYFYQYDSTNEDYPIVFDETADDDAPYFTYGVNTVGTRGQPGAYTILDLSAGFTGPLFYFSSGATEMGSFDIYTVKVVQNWAGNNVFSIQAPGEDLFYDQPDLSFNAGDTFLFDVGDSSITGPGYNLVFGTEIDNAGTILGSSYVTDLGTLIGLNLSSDYTGEAVYYFEDTSAGMGYVEVTVTEVHKIVELQSNGTFTLTSGSADLSYCAIGGGGSGGYGAINQGGISRGGNGGNGGQVIYGGYTFQNSIDYTITIGAGGTGHTMYNTDGSGTSISLSDGSQIVNAPGGLKGGNGGGNTVASVSVVANSSTGAEAVNNTSDTPSPGDDGTGPFNYGAGGGAGASADTSSSNKSSQGGIYGGGAGGHLTGFTSDREGKDALAYTGSGGGGGSGNGDATRYYGGNGGSGVVVIYVKNNSYNFTGAYNERIENVDVIVTPYTVTVTVSNEAFFIDTGSGAQSKPHITFTDGETYIFDQSDDSNDGYPIVFGTTEDDTSNLYTTGVTVVGTPGQPGAYTRLDYTVSAGTLFYYNNSIQNMGYVPVRNISNTSRYTNGPYPLQQPIPTVTEENNNKLYKFIAYPLDDANSKYQSHYQITLDQPTTVHYVVVGGGGAGGRYVGSSDWRSAGGGGGEVMQGKVELLAGTYDVKVGSGGHWTSNTSHYGGATGYMMDGFPSSFNTITALGGKGGPATFNDGRQSSYKTYGLGGEDSKNGGNGKQVSVNGKTIWLGGGGGGGKSSGPITSGGQGGGGKGGSGSSPRTKSTAGTDETGGGGGAGGSTYGNTGSEFIQNKWGYGNGTSNLLWVDETNFGGSGVVYLWHELYSYV
jgi:hypothetical protein